MFQMSETKHDKFVRLSTSRLEKAVKSIELLANLAGPNYEYSEAEAKEVVSILTNAVDVVSSAFKIDATPPQKPAEGEKPVPEVDDTKGEKKPTQKPAEDVSITIDPETSDALKYLHSYASWALDKLTYGKASEARDLLKIALTDVRDAMKKAGE